jgi:S-sulfosulfanyl-L-cysteine sulfohydrolase
LVDGGDFAETKEPGGWEKTTFLYDLLARLGYDAVTPGDGELTQGVDSLRALAARHPEVHVVSANLRDAAGQRVFPESVVIEKGGVRFGVTGTLGAEYYRGNLERERQLRDEFTFEDSRTALSRVVPDLAGRADVVVVLLHESVDSAMTFASAIPGMDVVIAGHDPGLNPAPEELNGALFVRGGNRGQYIYRVPLVLDPASRAVAGHGGYPRMLDKLVTKDAQMDFDVATFEQAFKAKYARTASLPGH